MASSDKPGRADQSGKPGKPADRMPKGVRGPSGPPPAPAAGRAAGRSTGGPRPAASSPGRRALEERSYALLRVLHGVPRWIVVVLPAALLFLGLVLTGPLAWLGGLLLLLVCALLAWLTALSWPAITPGSRLLRVVVVLALLGVAVLKLLGRF
jgi:hypothetical protein